MMAGSGGGGGGGGDGGGGDGDGDGEGSGNSSPSLIEAHALLEGGGSHAYQERNLESRCQKSRNND